MVLVFAGERPPYSVILLIGSVWRKDVINCYIKIENTYTGMTIMIDAEQTARYKVEQQTSDYCSRTKR